MTTQKTTKQHLYSQDKYEGTGLGLITWPTTTLQKVRYRLKKVKAHWQESKHSDGKVSTLTE